MRSIKADRFVLDGEIVVPAGKVFSFDALLQRIHPAQTRVEMLAKETPALMIVFDLLADPDGVLIDRSLPARRQRLEAFALKYFAKHGKMRLSPATTDAHGSEEVALSCRPDTRRHRRQAARHALQLGQPPRHAEDQELSFGRLRGRRFRYKEGKPVVGSLLLGLYDDNGSLNHVGFASNITRQEKPALTRKLEKLIAPPGFTGNAPGGPSRWSTKRSAEWQPLKPRSWLKWVTTISPATASVTEPA